MYGLVSSDHSRPRVQARPQPTTHHNQQQQQQGQESEPQDGHERRIRQRKSVYFRLVNFIKQAWTGVKFALDSDYYLDEFESPPRYRPESLQSLARLTSFTEVEIKRMYRGFKAECPSGVVEEHVFCDIYAQFFPSGANTSHYAHFFFNAFDSERSGLLSFEDLILGLSILSRGTLTEKLRWTFNLYDTNGDGYITRDEMKEVVSAIFELMGHCTEPMIEEDVVQERVDRIFQKMDRNLDGMVTLEEFLDSCMRDENISTSMDMFDSII